MNARSGPGSPRGLRGANRDRVLAALRGGREATQAELAAETGLAAATVSNIVRELAAQGRAEARDARRAGRRVRLVRLAPRAGLVAGMDVGRDHARVALADLDDRVLAETRIGLPPGHDAERGLDAAAAVLADLLDRVAVDEPGAGPLCGAALGLPAPVDAATGAVGAPGVLPGWVGVDAASRSVARFGVPTWVDNDASLGARAEQHAGALTGCADGLYLKLSDGVGAGLVLDGRVHRGRRGLAGEIGHVPVVEDGAVCRCGNRGCLETLVSTATVLGLLEPLVGPPADGPLTVAGVVARAREGFVPARRVLADTGRRVGTAVGGLASVLSPQRVVVGGALAQAGDLLLDPLREALTRAAMPATDPVEVVLSRLGDRAHVVGAVLTARERALAREVDGPVTRSPSRSSVDAGPAGV